MERHRRRCALGHTLLLASILAIAAGIAGPIQARTSHSLVLLVAADQLQSHRSAVLGSLPKLVGMLAPGDRFGAVIYSDVIEHVMPLASLTAQTLPDLKAALQRTISGNGVNGAVGFERALAALDNRSDTAGSGTDTATLIGFSSLAVSGQEPAVTQQFESWLEVSLMTQAMDRELRVLLLSGSPVSNTLQTLIKGTLKGRIVDLDGDASTLTAVLRDYAAEPPAQTTTLPVQTASTSQAATQSTSQTTTQASSPTASTTQAPTSTPTPITTDVTEPATNEPLVISDSPLVAQVPVEAASSREGPDTSQTVNDVAAVIPAQPQTPTAPPREQWTITLLAALALVAGTIILGGLVYTRRKQRQLALDQTTQLRAQQLGHGYESSERSTPPPATDIDDTVIDKTEVLLPHRISDDSFEFMANSLNQTGRQ